MRYNHFDMLPERAFLKVGGRITLEGGGGGGQQQPTTQTTVTSNIPEWLKEPTKRMVARGEELSEQPYQAYAGDRIAGFTPFQTQAFNQIANLQAPQEYAQAGQSIAGAQEFGAAGALQAMGYQPTQYNQYQMQGPQAIGAQNVYGTGYQAFGAEAAPDVNAANLQYFQMADPGEFDAATAAKYMSPYQQNVTDIAKREAIGEAQLLNRELGAKAAKAGAFGGSRFGIEQALLGSKLATNLADIETKGQQDAYLNAQQQLERDRAARLSVAGQNLQANLGVQSLGAGQSLQAQMANQQMRQQANLASQQAYNQALQFGATQEQAAQIANQAANLTASQANQQMQYQTGVQNLQALLTTQQQQDAARQAAAALNLQGSQLGANTGLQAGTQLANLGTTQQQQELNRIQALSAAGEQQQSMTQQQLSQLYQDYLEGRDWEKNQLGFLSGLIRGTPFSTSTTTSGYQTGPTTSSQLLSGALGVAGLASLLKKKGGMIDKTEGLPKRDKKAMMGDGLAKAGLYKAMKGA